jgi:biopolymer transport protein ExbD/biopolymer transport protein TolR
MGVGGSKGGAMNEINMTPMIDVLLVLLIIFMVVQQGLQRGLSVQVPPPKEKEELAQKPPDDQQIVLEVEPGPKSGRAGGPSRAAGSSFCAVRRDPANLSF